MSLPSWGDPAGIIFSQQSCKDTCSKGRERAEIPQARDRHACEQAHVDADVALDLAAGLAVGQHVQQGRLAGAGLAHERRQDVGAEGAADIVED